MWRKVWDFILLVFNHDHPPFPSSYYSAFAEKCDVSLLFTVVNSVQAPCSPSFFVVPTTIMLVLDVQRQYVRFVARVINTRPDLVAGRTFDVTRPLSEPDWVAQVSSLFHFLCTLN
jgi:hypothetical protein